jgi:hypothetical protein
MLADDGPRAALDRLWPETYDELRRLAARLMRGERGNHTLQATALVHEAYLKLQRSSDSGEMGLDGRRAAASEADAARPGPAGDRLRSAERAARADAARDAGDRAAAIGDGGGEGQLGPGERALAGRDGAEGGVS